MVVRREYRRSNSRTEKRPLDTAREAFAWLVTGPHPVSVDGRLFAGLPDRPVPLDELRDRLLRRRCPMGLRDAVWAHLVLRSRMEGATWTVGCVGMALPALVASAAKLCARFAADHHDVDAAVVEGFVTELARINLRKPGIASRLRWAAYRSGHACVRDALDAPMPVGAGGYSSTAPPPPFGHPDLVLLRAVADGVLTAAEASLIGATRLEHEPLARLATQRGVGYEALKKARRRAEHRLRDYLTDTASGVGDTEVADPAITHATLTSSVRTPSSRSQSVSTTERAGERKRRAPVSRSGAESGVRARGRTPRSPRPDPHPGRTAGAGCSEEVRRCA